MTEQIDGKAVERLRGYAKDMQHLDDEELYEDGAALLALIEERDALQKQVEGLTKDLATAVKYRDAYRECDRIASEALSAALAREGAVATAAWIAGRDAAAATFGAHAMLIANVQPPTDAAAALARREDEAFNAGMASVKNAFLESAQHDQGGLDYSAMVGIPICNADELETEVAFYERAAEFVQQEMDRIALKRSGKEGRDG